MKSGENPRISVRFLGTVGKKTYIFAQYFQNRERGEYGTGRIPVFADGGDLKGNMGREPETGAGGAGQLDICGKHNTK